MKGTLTAAAALVLLAGCASSSGTTDGGNTSTGPDEDSASSLTLSQAFCNDLEDGLTIMNVYGGVSDQFTPQEFADYAYGAAAISCPDELKDNEGLRTFLEAWDIDPDA